MSDNKLNNFFFALFGFRPGKSKTQLLAVILFHLLVWLFFLWFPLLFYPARFAGDTVWQRELLTKILPIGFFYLNYYLLLPRYFEKRKLGAYFLAILLVVICIAGSDLLIRKELDNNFFRDFMAVRNAHPLAIKKVDGIISDTMSANGGYAAGSAWRPGPAPVIYGEASIGTAPPKGATLPAVMLAGHKFIFGIPKPAFLMSVRSTLSNCFIMLIIGGMLRLAYSFLKSENKKKSLENATLNAEVDLLKAQINPHFLFNTLNSIYSLATVKSDKTDVAILKLSELLRYALYDTADDKVALFQDIQYINNYIDLQRLRLSNKVTVLYSVEGNVDNKIIAPMLLITFIENAFKHGVSYLQQCLIKIDIRIFDEILTLEVTNPIIENNSFATGGIGLKNVQRRLALLYPHQHELHITQNQHQFSVSLKISI